MNYTRTIKFYKKRAVVAECHSAWLQQELNHEEECHHDEIVEIKSNIEYEQRGYH